jgi:hypothetical protein
VFATNIIWIIINVIESNKDEYLLEVNPLHFVLLLFVTIPDYSHIVGNSL